MPLLVACTFGLTCCSGDREESGSEEAGVVGSGVVTWPEDWDWSDGLPGCNWFFAAGPYDDHSLYAVQLDLPMADFDAGVDVSYSRSLSANEVVVWRDDATSDTGILGTCNDIELSLVGRAVPVLTGNLQFDAMATGPDNVCGSPQTYDVTWTLSEMITQEGAVDDIGPLTSRAGFFGDCYG